MKDLGPGTWDEGDPPKEVAHRERAEFWAEGSSRQRLRVLGGR